VSISWVSLASNHLLAAIWNSTSNKAARRCSLF
jgi:hypothetical protein